MNKLTLLEHLHITFPNFAKLFKKGDVSALYRKMYSLAEDLAIDEMQKRQSLILSNIESKLPVKNLAQEYINELIGYKGKRIQYHMDEMNKLLKLRSEVYSDIKKE